MKVSQRKYAEMRGVNLYAVQRAIKSGRIRTDKKGQIETEQADVDWENNTDPAKQRSYPKDDVGESVPKTGTFQQARTAGEYYRAMFMKERLRKFKNELIEREKVNEHIFRLGRATRDVFLNWPTRDAALIAAELGVDEHKTRVILDERIRNLLSELGEFAKPII